MVREALHVFAEFSKESKPNKATFLLSNDVLLKASTLEFLILMCIISTVEMSPIESRISANRCKPER